MCRKVLSSHAFPSQSEVCSICGQLVQYNRTELSIVDGENLEVPRYPSQNNLQNIASLLPLASCMKDASNISEIQPETQLDLPLPTTDLFFPPSIIVPYPATLVVQMKIITPILTILKVLVQAPVRTAHQQRLIFPHLRCRLLSMNRLRKIPIPS